MSASVALAVGDPLTRLGITEALAAGELEIRGDAADADALLAAVRAAPDLCLVAADDQARDGGRDGLVTAVRRLATAWPAAAVVAFAAAPDAHLLLRVVRAGGRGCLPADTSAERLPIVMRGVLAGEPAAPRRLFGELLDRLRVEGMELTVTGASGRPVILSARESAVLSLLDEGRTPAQVAATLGIAPVTVRRHVSTAMRRLQVADRAAALALLRAARGP